MKYTKTKLADLKRAYSTNHLVFDKQQYVLYASEASVDEPGFAYAYPMNNLSKQEVIWDNAGGCMSILQDPYYENQFLAVQEFYLKQHPSQAKLVWGERKNDGKWEVHDLFHLPFLHRFGIIKEGDDAYIVACTIARDKLNKDDWSLPGEIWAGKLPHNHEEPKLSVIKTGCFHNHGFYQHQEKGKDVIYTSSDEGVFRITHDGEFKVEQILEGAVGEIALQDIDGDGKLEMMTIEPFHGNQIKIYHLNEEGKYQAVWTYDHKIDFAHTLVGDTLCNTKCFVAGVRREEAEAFVVTYKDGTYHEEIVDKNGGPANLCVIHDNGTDYISCSNHTLNECALYKVGE